MSAGSHPEALELVPPKASSSSQQPNDQLSPSSYSHPGEESVTAKPTRDGVDPTISHDGQKNDGRGDYQLLTCHDGQKDDQGASYRDRASEVPGKKKLRYEKMWNNFRKPYVAVVLTAILVLILVGIPVWRSFWPGKPQVDFKAAPTVSSGSIAGTTVGARKTATTLLTAPSTAALKAGNLLKLALNLTSVTDCVRDNLNPCSLQAKSWLRMPAERTNLIAAFLAPLMCVAKPISHGTDDASCQSRNSWYTLDREGIVISQRGEYHFYVQAVCRCTGSYDALNSASLSIMVNNNVEVTVPGACLNKNRIFPITAFIGLILNANDKVRISLETASRLLNLEVRAPHSMTYVQVSRR